MRRGLISDLHATNDRLSHEAARELTHLRRILSAIASSKRYTPGTGTERRRVYDLAAQGLQFSKSK